jgi:outer membrane protein
MATDALESREGRLAELLRLLMPFPGRLEFAVRLALICALTTLVVEIYQTPKPALTVYLVFFLNKAEFLPKVFVAGTGSYNNGTLSVTGIPAVGNLSSITNLSGNHFGGIVFAGVAVPVFDGGTRAAILEQAQTKVDNAGLALTRTRDETVRQIVLANNALRTSLSAYTATKAVTSAAKTTFDAALAAYRSGVGSITDATMAETQLLQAKNASTDTYSTALSAAATLALSTGSLGAPLQ